MRFLVTGAAGFVGTALLPRLLARGHSVRALVRAAAPVREAAPNLQYALVPDIVSADWPSLLRRIEVVVHLAAIAHRGETEERLREVNATATAKLAEAAAQTARRFVFVSTAKVHGEDSGGRAWTEADPPQPADAYARAKLEAENALCAIAARTGLELAILRPALVFGAGVKGNFLRLLQWVDRGWPLPLAGIENRRSLLYVGNLAEAILAASAVQAAQGTFLLAEEKPLSSAELARRIACALGKESRLFRAPVSLLRALAALAGSGDDLARLIGNLVVDGARFRRTFAWRSPSTLEEGLTETAHWFRSLARGKTGRER